MSTTAKIPEGYLRDPQGRLVPLEMVKEIDLQRNQLVQELFQAAKAQNESLAEFKTTTFERLEAFLKDSAKTFKVKMVRAKGNYTLLSFDGAFKIQVQRQENVSFNENLQTAKELIDACIREWSEGSDARILTLINDAFQVDQEGKVSVTKILALRRLKIDDPKWKRAMEAIGQSMQVTGSKDYLRFYERDEKTGEYRAVSLDLAVV